VTAWREAYPVRLGSKLRQSRATRWTIETGTLGAWSVSLVLGVVGIASGRLEKWMAEDGEISCE
jgi:hypothetical protein